MDTEKIKAKVDALRQQRDAFIRRAEQEIAAMNGAINALEDLLREEEPPAESEPIK
jgi:hypothetical protein